ncbi:hypothetical protein BCV69DRAFT_217230 [Microstroma glucosiphilum]|uniref:C2H2-type domain-containing protein n=1 Tax=Pseudomicrostroma glucosiphilum TaxID=1684307 RepID=A0A316U438_9BASI|nr:hypothetical protein BCV69DRAFT_217230 [Pseudomicrostroma glucosiphilum]PWN20042.1 hypothetical protein BCV69DRAFT_217230 [Pseudomicrostroma glucosiphilum]
MSMTSQARPHFPPPQHQQIQSYPSSNGGFGSPPSPLQTATSHDQQQQQRNQSVSTDLASAQADSSQQPWTYSYDSVPRPHEHSEWNQYPNAQHQQQHMSMQQQQQLAQDQLVQHYQQGSSPPPPHMAMSVHQAQQQQQHVQAMPPGQQAMQQFQQQQHQHQQHQHQQHQHQQQQQLQLQQQQQQQQHTFAALPANAMGPSMTFHRSSLPASFGSAPSEYYGPADPAYVQHRASLVGPTAWLPGNYPFEPQGGEVMPDMMTVGGHHQPRKLSVTEMPNGSPSRSPTSSGKARKRQRSPTREDPLGGPAPKSLAKRKNSDARVTDRDGTAPTTIFQCRGFGDCNMTFTRSEHLARHIRKHTGERPFGCHCGKAFSRLDNLRQHAQTVHSDESERNELMMSELTNLHAHLAASAARDQHAQAFLQRAEGQGAVVRKHRGPKKGGKNGNEDGTAAQMGHSSASPTFPQPHSAGFVQHDPSYMGGAGPHFGPRADGMAVSHLQQHPHRVHYDLHQFGPSASSNAVQRIPESSDSTAYPYGTAADAEMHHIGSHNMRVAPSVAPPPPGYIHVSYGDGLVLQQQANPQQLYSLGPDAGAIGPHQNVSPYQEARYPHSAPIVGGTGPTMSYAIEQIPQHLQQQAPHQTGAQSKADSEATTRAQINDEHNVHPAYNSLDAARGESHTHSKLSRRRPTDDCFW